MADVHFFSWRVHIQPVLRKKIKFDLEIADYDIFPASDIVVPDNAFFSVGAWDRILNSDVWADGILLSAEKVPMALRWKT